LAWKKNNRTGGISQAIAAGVEEARTGTSRIAHRKSEIVNGLKPSASGQKILLDLHRAPAHCAPRPMQAAPTTYCATQAVAVILNDPNGRRVSWRRVKKLHSTGQQEETV
jgi:hypothetical protein